MDYRFDRNRSSNRPVFPPVECGADCAQDSVSAAGILGRQLPAGLSFLKSGKSFGLVVLHSTLLWIVIAMQFWFMLWA
jgi:hypothetical protein